MSDNNNSQYLDDLMNEPVGHEREEVSNAYLRARAFKCRNEARIKHEQAELERVKKEKLLGTLIPLSKAQEAFSQLGSKTRLHLQRLIPSLPPKLEGLTGQQMIPILREAIDEILETLSQEVSITPEEVSTKELETLAVIQDEKDD